MVHNTKRSPTRSCDGTHGGALDLAGEGLDGDRETLDAAGGEPTRAVEGRGETSGESSGRSPLRPVGGDKTCRTARRAGVR